MLEATAMTLASIIMPDWVSYTVSVSTGPITGRVSRTVGLHQTCSSVADPECRPYPSESECQGEERYFCSMWRTTGFLMSFATVVELATIVGFLVTMAGGKMKREKGWRILGILLGGVAAVQFSAMAIVVSSILPEGIPRALSLMVSSKRRTSSTTTSSSSSRDGDSIPRGFSARRAAPSLSYPRWVSRSPPLSYRPKMATNSSTTRSMCDGRLGVSGKHP